jgi:hypothetical protein
VTSVVRICARARAMRVLCLCPAICYKITVCTRASVRVVCIRWARARACVQRCPGAVSNGRRAPYWRKNWPLLVASSFLSSFFSSSSSSKISRASSRSCRSRAAWLNTMFSWRVHVFDHHQQQQHGKASVFDWEAPVLDWEVPVFDRKVPVV